MNRLHLAFPYALALGTLAGCGGAATLEEPRQAPTTTASRPERTSEPAAPRARAAEVSWDTDRDRPFAEFLRDNSAGMIKEASVGIEKKGRFQVVLDKSVAPEDTLKLTKSLMAGARKDFADRPITLAVFDPSHELILRSHYAVGKGVSYKLAGESKEMANRQPEPEVSAAPAQSASTRSGATEADRKFAEWAEEHGKSYLRYVEADLERHGRLWFGVTPDVKPDDVPKLTKSLLEGAHREFPRGDLVASVFDPEGGKDRQGDAEPRRLDPLGTLSSTCITEHKLRRCRSCRSTEIKITRALCLSSCRRDHRRAMMTPTTSSTSTTSRSRLRAGRSRKGSAKPSTPKK